MKFALIFFLSFVSLSYQQRLLYRPFYNAIPAARHFYDFSRYFDRNTDANNVFGQDNEDGDATANAEGRAKFNFQDRFFFNPLSAMPTYSPLFTSTSIVHTTAIVTVASIRSCIGANQFAVVGSGSLASTLFGACVRRRRDAEAAQHLVEVPQEFAPTQVQPVEPTFVPNMRESRDVEPEIQSSQTSLERSGRSYLPNNKIATTTYTVTDYSFVTTPVIKNFILTGAGSLSCLPYGYNVC